MGPGSAAHRFALRSIRGTHPRPCSNSKHAFATPRRDAPELCIYLSPPWRAWGMPGARCTRGLVCTLYW